MNEVVFYNLGCFILQIKMCACVICNFKVRNRGHCETLSSANIGFSFIFGTFIVCPCGIYGL